MSIKYWSAAFLIFALPCISAQYEVIMPAPCLLQASNNRLENILSINNKSQILGCIDETYKTSQGVDNTYQLFYLCGTEGQIKFINPVEKHIAHLIKVNNRGKVVGCCGSVISIWDELMGFRLIDIREDLNCNAADLIDFNDIGQAIGNYYPKEGGPSRAFLWDTWKAIDMGPGSEFANKLEALGYHVMDINLNSINNLEEITGIFKYGKYHPQKKEYIYAASLPFFYDGQIHVLKIDEKIRDYFNIQINNNSTAIINAGRKMEGGYVSAISFIWNSKEGFTPLPEGFIAEKINDNNIILGYLGLFEFDPVIWKNGELNSLSDLLGSPMDNLASPFSENLAVEQIVKAIDINNKDEILCVGSVWNDYCPCILRPKKVDEQELP